MTIDHNKMGTFMVEFETIEDTPRDTWATLMSDLVIIDAELDLESNRIVYTAISDRFSELTEIAQVPRYVPSYNQEEGRFVWIRTNAK